MQRLQQDARHCGFNQAGDKTDDAQVDVDIVISSPENINIPSPVSADGYLPAGTHTRPQQDNYHCAVSRASTLTNGEARSTAKATSVVPRGRPQLDGHHCEVTSHRQEVSSGQQLPQRHADDQLLAHVPGNQSDGEAKLSSHKQPSCQLNPESEPFTFRDPNLVQDGCLVPDLLKDWAMVQDVQAGGSGPTSGADTTSWDKPAREASGHAGGDYPTDELPDGPLLPFPLMQDAVEAGFAIPAKPILKVNSLQNYVLDIPAGKFTDKFLPAPKVSLEARSIFTPEYFRGLHNLVAAPGIRMDGSTYPASTPNFLGARIKLKHVGLKVERWRFHLLGYENSEIIQFIEYGFPLGLSELPDLQSCTRNHGSAYTFYPHVDKFIAEEVVKGGLAGPFEKVPWWDSIISPIMTAPKKPSSRRTVFDATYGEKSLNNSTPGDFYMGQPCIYTYPKIDDFRRMVLRCGRNSFLWKRDLARFFLQIPMDPLEYSRVCLVWRGLFFFFLCLAFGLRHSGLQGQRLTDALSWIHRRRGLDTDMEKPFNCVNYSDDMGGVEETKDRAMESFIQLGWLMEDLGLEESVKKAEPPSQAMTYLGVMFDSSSMVMRVPPEKLSEIKSEIKLWVRKTTITRRDLQSLLGKLFWISKVVRHARVFMGRLLQQLRTMAGLGDSSKVKLTEESRKDLAWWGRYLDHFNGVQMIVEEDPFLLELDQMLDRPFELCAGDATPTACGAFHGTQYWCRPLPRDLQDPQIPIHLKEFWAVIVSARLWGNYWSGRCITIFCDNDAVVDTINYKKPKDAALLSLLREFLYIVVTMKFFPVLRKISTTDNHLADFISRRHDVEAADKVFAKAGLHDMVPINVPDDSFKLTEPW